MELFQYVIEGANDFFWGYFLITALICVGLYFTVKSKFVQFSYFKEMFKALVDKPNNTEGKHSISSFQAFCISVASRVGTGNLAGVATAIALGGYSAVFWMWIIALVGSATSFVE
ncbi:MAG: alanine:cation symporter family protein, partial [Rikenellaceae bacterium]